MPDLHNIKLIIFDVDGVLTDGSIYVDDSGRETKRFFVRDGFGIKAAMTLGLKVGVITGRTSPSVTLRMTDLGIELYSQGSLRKSEALEKLCERAGVSPDETAYLGDDLLDLPAMVRCGYPMAVANAAPEVMDAAKFVTQSPGGRGAAREAIEHILKAQGRWDEVIERFAE